MHITNNILRKLSQCTCPVHGDDIYFRIGIIEDSTSVYCCELCKAQVAAIISEENQKEILKRSSKVELRNIEKILDSINVMADMADRIITSREATRNKGKKLHRVCSLN